MSHADEVSGYEIVEWISAGPKNYLYTLTKKKEANEPMQLPPQYITVTKGNEMTTNLRFRGQKKAFVIMHALCFDYSFSERLSTEELYFRERHKSSSDAGFST